MILFCRAHGLHRGMLITGVIAVGAWWLTGLTLPVPQLLQGRAQPLQVQLLFAALFGPATVSVFAGAALEVESVARRRLVAQDLLLLAGLLGPVLTVFALEVLTGATTSMLGMVGSTGLFTGLTLLCIGLASRNSALVLPIVYFLMMGAVGTTSDGSAQWWAFPRDPATASGLVISLAVLATGWTAFHLRARRRTAAARLGS